MPLTSSAASVLRLTGVRTRLGRTVTLDGLSLSVEAGQVVGVVGEASSSVFDTVCGFVRPESGELTWHGSALRPRPHRLTTLGLARTLQGVGLYGGLTVLENVLVGSPGVPRVPAVPPGRRAGIGVALVGAVRARLHGAALRDLASDRLTRLGLEEYVSADLAEVPAPLHGRVVLARALLAGPELLVLDDPTAGLGPEESATLADWLRPVTGAVLLATKDAGFATQACDHVVKLEGGDGH